jgi:hypothetical protein
MPTNGLATQCRSARCTFRQLAKAFTRLAPYLTVVTENDGNSVSKSGRRRPRLTARQRAALKLQGKYIGTMRGSKPRRRARVK